MCMFLAFSAVLDRTQTRFATVCACKLHWNRYQIHQIARFVDKCNSRNGSHRFNQIYIFEVNPFLWSEIMNVFFFFLSLLRLQYSDKFDYMPLILKIDFQWNLRFNWLTIFWIYLKDGNWSRSRYNLPNDLHTGRKSLYKVLKKKCLYCIWGDEWMGNICD